MPHTIINPVGFLATGNEIVEGDILNTNGQTIAHSLVEQGLTAGMHVMASDRQIEIEVGLRFLLEHHEAVITIGGLGPTSDDRTRFALSAVVNQPLVFDESSWQHICQRFKQLNLSFTDTVQATNRQQAFFPIGAIIFPNENGSAAGCLVEYQTKKIFMLPGPPHECLPMFEKFVLPLLINQVAHKITKLHWVLTGAIESDIAERVDTAVKNFAVTTGYRAAKPYLEVKIYVQDDVDIEAVKNVVEAIIGPYLFTLEKS